MAFLLGFLIVESAHMRYAPLERDLSRLVLGTLVVSPAVLDEYVRFGGNVIDTAAAYGDGDAERALGAWLESRPGVRERLTIVSKGAHPSADRRRVTAEDISSDLHDTIARLHGPVDLYLLHRDDPSMPVGPIVEALNEHRDAGRLRAFGASNWTCARIDEANEYARDHGLEGFTCSSVHLSLATQNEEHWPDTFSACDPAIAAWHERTRMPLLAWSAQARGFFAGRVDERVYANDDNRERLRRAERIAGRLGVTANQVALAWVLHRPFPVYAAFGVRTVETLHDAFGALDVELTEEELRWLNLEPAALRA
jgi:aryl-alcohol dehydrogenase-like predicted oxidoreductase